MDNDINQQILEELRKLRKTNQWTSACAILVLLAFLIWAFLLIPPRSAEPWSQVSTAMRQSDYPKALQIAQKLTAEHPSDHYGHEYLGNIYLAIGDAAHAETEYARAYELLPSEAIQTKLDAIRKRREREAAKPNP